MLLVANLLLFMGMAVGLAIIPFGLPGIGVIFGSTLLYALATQFNAVSLNLILVLGVLTILGETADNWLMAAGAKRFGASTAAAWLSLLGGFLGALILGPFLAVALNVVGPVVGAFLGAFIAVVLYEHRQKQNWREALRAGWGTLLGRVAGIALKMVVGVGMAAAVAWSVL
ncbi:MAG TPA: DUF456 domain-containing protein, partial [Terriglobia bacterium]|nr:DUF456 domain-containing protein [Terriglobia bacterium]